MRVGGVGVIVIFHDVPVQCLGGENAGDVILEQVRHNDAICDLSFWAEFCCFVAKSCQMSSTSAAVPVARWPPKRSFLGTCF